MPFKQMEDITYSLGKITKTITNVRRKMDDAIDELIYADTVSDDLGKSKCIKNAKRLIEEGMSDLIGRSSR